MSKRRIVFTGGGTAGHVTPNLALIESARECDWDCVYIGSKDSIEEQLTQREAITFYAIVSGKLRREMSLKNLLTPFKVLCGIFQSLYLLMKLKPQLVFSKGGYVSFPVVFSAWLLRIPVIIHESDFSPGLANRLSFPFARKICVTFFNDAFNDKNKILETGTPIRRQLFEGDPDRARTLCDFHDNKVVLLLIGGSQGSWTLNRVLRDNLDLLLETFNVIHLCGANNIDQAYRRSGYVQFEYLHDELADCFALADVIVARAGANVICELLALKKLMCLIPLSRKVSRGDQIENAHYFSKHGYALCLEESALSSETFLNSIHTLLSQKKVFLDAIESAKASTATSRIIALFEEIASPR